MAKIRELFRLNQLHLDYHRPQDFVTTFWQSNPEEVSGLYVSYRFFTAGLFLSLLVARGTTTRSPEHFFIFLTNLGFIMQTLHLVVSAVLPVQHLLNISKGLGHNHMTLMAKLSWTLYNITNTTTVVIAVTYWAFIFKPETQFEAMSFFTHGFICIASLSDIFVATRPCRLLHFYQPVLVVGLYVVFSVIYWAAGGRNSNGSPYIYPVTNWANPGLTVPLVMGTVLVFIPLIHAFLWVLHQLRDWLLLRIKVITSIQPAGGQ